MSQENVEIVRSICAAWDRGDYSAVEWADPDIEFVARRRTVTGQLEGAGGHGRGLARLAERVGRFPQQVDEYRELDDERVLVLFRCSGRGKTSGMDLAEMHPLMAGCSTFGKAG